MNKYVFSCFVGVAFGVCVSGQSSFVQKNPSSSNSLNSSTPHDYYIYLSGVETGDDVRFLETTIQKKPGVSYFLAYKFPCRYFRLKAKDAVTQDEFASWIGSKYKIGLYGEGEKAKENALVMYESNHKK